MTTNNTPLWQRDDAPYNQKSFFRACLDCWRDAIAKDNFKVVVILTYAIFALTLWKYIPAAPKFADPQTGVNLLAQNFGSGATVVVPMDGSLVHSVSVVDFLWNARKIWAAFLIMGVIPALIVKFVFHEKLSDYGVTFGVKSYTIRSFVTFAPVLLVVTILGSGDRGYYNVYPYNPMAPISHGFMIAHSLMYLLLYYTAWEFMFRGFIQLGLADRLGAVPALLVQVVASTMLHYGHPAGETFGCIAGGVLWGFLVFRTRSLVSGIGQHALMGIVLDWALTIQAL
ncbi:MAG: type II CAAX endopeptidase family protein [Planctomycetia bacterium]|nr:type II CAAX endopeptidase family protein [Planctomycetia bacterium]